MDQDFHTEQPAPLPVPSAPARRWRWLVWLSAAGLLALLVVAGWGFLNLYLPVQLSKPELVDVRKNTNFRYLAGRLQQRGIIPNATAFYLYARLTGHAEKVKVGEYEITNGMRPVDTLDVLISGRARVFTLTVPEGKWLREYPTYLGVQWPQAGQDFPALAEYATPWKAKVPFPVNGETLEGYLFPDTYRFPREATAAQMIEKMLERFQVTCWKAYQADPPRDGRSLYEVLILASLVEAEAKVATERPRIAGVYMNRLRKNMPLQCDATVLYAHGQRLSRVLYRDLEIDSPYNTYRYRGLPVGPICNPGLDAFTAALHPEQVPYLYYVAQGDGSHIFTTTLAEHAAAIRRVRGR